MVVVVVVVTFPPKAHLAISEYLNDVFPILSGLLSAGTIPHLTHKTLNSSLVPCQAHRNLAPRGEQPCAHALLAVANN